ncbi:MAG: hypothetical protein FJY97_12745 [candidate division Zixibacteria bacterium]|nr:hypothetical protein [candidate division Zixibacteria bacterium]
MDKFVSTNRYLFPLLLTCLSIYFFHLGPLPGVNENRYIDQTRSIVEDGVFHIDRYHFNTIDKGEINGHYYPTAPPGLSLFSVPIYLIVKEIFEISPIVLFKNFDVKAYIRVFLGNPDAPDYFIEKYPFFEFLVCHILFTIFLCCLPALGIIVLLDKALEIFTPLATAIQRVWILFSFAFGTLMFFYSTRFFAHALSTFMLFAAFLLIYAVKKQRVNIRWIGVAGLLNGFSLLVDYITFPAVLIVGIYGLFSIEKRELWRYISGSGLPVICLLVYHAIAFGHPFKMPQQFMSGESGNIYANQFGLGLPDPIILIKLMLSSYRGFFLYMPIMIYGVFLLIKGLTKRDHPHRVEWMVFGGIFIALILFNSAMKINWVGGYIYGPRYLIPAIPFLMLPLGEAENYFSRWAIKGAIILSVLINWSGTQYIVSQTFYGSLLSFLLSGPTSQGYQFLESYFHGMSGWDVPVSATGGYIVLGVLVVAIWRFFMPQNEKSKIAE